MESGGGGGGGYFDGLLDADGLLLLGGGDDPMPWDAVFGCPSAALQIGAEPAASGGFLLDHHRSVVDSLSSSASNTADTLDPSTWNPIAPVHHQQHHDFPHNGGVFHPSAFHLHPVLYPQPSAGRANDDGGCLEPEEFYRHWDLLQDSDDLGDADPHCSRNPPLDSVLFHGLPLVSRPATTSTVHADREWTRTSQPLPPAGFMLKHLPCAADDSLGSSSGSLPGAETPSVSSRDLDGGGSVGEAKPAPSSDATLNRFDQATLLALRSQFLPHLHSSASNSLFSPTSDLQAMLAGQHLSSSDSPGVSPFESYFGAPTSTSFIHPSLIMGANQQSSCPPFTGNSASKMRKSSTSNGAKTASARKSASQQFTTSRPMNVRPPPTVSKPSSSTTRPSSASLRRSATPPSMPLPTLPSIPKDWPHVTSIRDFSHLLESDLSTIFHVRTRPAPKRDGSSDSYFAQAQTHNSSDASAPLRSKQAISLYLSNGGRDNVLVFYTPLVAQKSYGTEKRFFCPPPMVWLMDAHQTELEDSQETIPWSMRVAPDGTGCLASGDCGGRAVTFRFVRHWKAETPDSVIGVFRNVYAGDLKNAALKYRRLYDVNCVSGEIVKAGIAEIQSMFERVAFGEMERKRYLEFNLRLCPQQHSDTFNAQSYLGLFPSERIALISKPTKKKNQSRVSGDSNATTTSSKSAGDDLIYSGCTIALYNRLRSQNIATKFLGLPDRKDDGDFGFVGKSSDWDMFIIELHGADTPSRPIEDGDAVVLRSSKTHWVSPVLVVRTVDSNGMITSGNTRNGDILTQLQKFALELRDMPNHFLNIDQRTNKVELYNSFTRELVAMNAQDLISPTGKRYSGSTSDAFSKKSKSALTSEAGAVYSQMSMPITESAVWTVVGVDALEYHWFDPRQTLRESHSSGLQTPTDPILLRDLPVTPVPFLVQADVTSGGSSQRLELNICLQLLPLLDALSAVEMVDRFEDLDAFLRYDVFVGNVECPLVDWRHNLLSIRKRLLEEAAVHNLDATCDIKIICELPSWHECVHAGNWSDELNRLGLGPVSGGQAMTPSSPGVSGEHPLETSANDAPAAVNPDHLLGEPIPVSESWRPFLSIGRAARSNQVLAVQVPILLVRQADGVVYRTQTSIHLVDKP